jgi:hypothetical protein
VLAAAALLGTCCAARAADDDSLVERWMDLYAREAGSIQMQVDGTSGRVLDLHREPLLKYNNPVRRNQQHGALFLWTDRGRPALIGSIWSGVDAIDSGVRNITHEWHSLSTELAVARRGEEELWTADEPGIEWQPLPGQPPPHASRPLRLAQMRQIVRAWTATIASEEGDLRLMAQPLYRYPEDTPGVLDGAVFAFVMGTDPELFVLLEARTGAGTLRVPSADKEVAGTRRVPSTDEKPAVALAAPSPEWSVAFARFTHIPLSVKAGDAVLWECARATPYKRSGRYYLMWKADRRSATLTEGK